MTDFEGLTAELLPSVSSKGDSPHERDYRERTGRTSPAESIRIPDLKSLPGSVYENLCFGAKFNCSMSLIRKYLCLFVLLDLVVHSLIYIIYLKHVQDSSLVDVIEHQIKYYDVQTSFIDTIILSAGRFLTLEYSYGLLRSDSWAAATLTTALTSVFTIIKALHYDWEYECRRVWLVCLMATSFASAWSEAFLVNFPLVGMENLAEKYARGKPEAFIRDLPRIKLFNALLPITEALFRNILAGCDSTAHSHSTTE